MNRSNNEEPCHLATLTERECLSVLPWRAQARASLRTSHGLTETQQLSFFRDVVCNPNAPHRYWAVRREIGGRFAGMAGLTFIQWENKLAEISLIVDPAVRGLGKFAVWLVLKEAFDHMGLATVIGECYACNLPGLRFWRQIADAYKADLVELPRRKFYDGALWPSLYFSITDDNWKEHRHDAYSVACIAYQRGSDGGDVTGTNAQTHVTAAG